MKRSIPLVGNLDTHRAWQDRSRQKQMAKPRRQPSRVGEAQARRLVYARSGGACEFGIPGICTRIGAEWCHRLNRSQGGKWLASNGMHGCRVCHRVTTNTNGRRRLYEAHGWVLRRHQDPVDTPSLIHGRWVLLTDDGRAIDATEGIAA